MPAGTGLWRHADFMKLWTGQTVSGLGSRITRDGLPLAALLVLGATPFQMGLLTAISSIPVLLAGPFAGVWADRLRRRPLMVASDLSRALVLASVPAAALLGLLNMGQLYLVAALAGTLTVLFNVGYQAYLPSLVGRDRLVEGNSKLMLSDSAAEVLGPGLAGLLVQALTAPIAIALDAMTFLFSGLMIAWIGQPEAAPPKPERQQLVKELIEGLQVVFRDPILRAFALNAGTRSFFGSFIGTLYGLYAIRQLGMGPVALGITITFGGVGALLGAAMAERIARRTPLGAAILAAAILGGALTFLIPLARGPLIAAISFLITGQLLGDMMDVIYTISATSLSQAITPDRYLGRMGASMEFMASGVGPLGAVVGGYLGQVVGVRPTLMIAALGILLSSLWLFFSPIRFLKSQPVDVSSEPS